MFLPKILSRVTKKMAGILFSSTASAASDAGDAPATTAALLQCDRLLFLAEFLESGIAALSASNSCLGDVLRKECSRACKHDARFSSAKKFRRFASFYYLGSICSGPESS
jgi:hypothetical protein